MRARTLRRAVVLGVAATFIVASAGAYTFPTVRPFCSAVPSLAQCQSPGYLNLCHVDTECTAVVHAAASSTARGSTRAVLASNAAAAPKAPVLTKDGDVTPNGIATRYNLAGLSSMVPSATLEGHDLALWLPLEKSTTVSQSTKITTLHPAWEADGKRVSSCDEYVFQKTYDYARFDETAKALGDDAWAIADAAFMPGTPGIANRVLREFMTGQPIALLPFISPPTRQLKNVFFHNDAHVFDGLAMYQTDVVAPDLAAFLSSPDFKSGQVPPPGNTWDFHQQQMALHRAKGVSPAEYEAFALRRRHYGALVYAVWQGARAMADAVIAFELAKNGPTQFCTHPMYPQKSVCAILKPDGTLNGIVDPILDLNAPYASVGDADAAWIDELAKKYPDAAVVREQARADMMLAVTHDPASLNLDDSCLAQPGDPTCATRATSYAGGHAARIRAEYLLAQYMNEEWARPGHGCLDVTSSWCDWSPKELASGIVGRLGALSGKLHHECVANTGDDFVALAYQDTPVNGHRRQDSWFPPYSVAKNQTTHYQLDYTQTTELVDLFVTRFREKDELWKSYAWGERVLLGQVADLPFDKAGTMLSASSSDSNSIGDPSTFGASYGYSVGWNLWPSKSTTNTAGENVICRLAGNANASLNASVTAFGIKKPLADAGLDSAETDGDSHVNAYFSVFDTPIFVPVSIKPNDPLATFNAISPVAPHSLADVTIADQWFVLLGVVPVHLHADVALTAGATVTATGSNPAGCDVASVPFKMQAGFTPYVRADLVATAAVDVLLASAGVRASLNLVTVSIPLDFSFVATPGNGTTNVAYNNTLDASLDELSGSIELYAELDVPFGPTYTTSNTIFSWQGFHQNHAIWATKNKKPFSLDALSLRIYGGAFSNPANGGGQ
jgi:hypothetical protein